jgi:hypothetical protein
MKSYLICWFTAILLPLIASPRLIADPEPVATFHCSARAFRPRRSARPKDSRAHPRPLVHRHSCSQGTVRRRETVGLKHSDGVRRPAPNNQASYAAAIIGPQESLVVIRPGRQRSGRFELDSAAEPVIEYVSDRDQFRQGEVVGVGRA